MTIEPIAPSNGRGGAHIHAMIWLEGEFVTLLQHLERVRHRRCNGMYLLLK
jgi:hypothetical protein